MIEYEWTQKDCEAYANNLRPMIKYDHQAWAIKINQQINSKEKNIKYLDIATGPGFLQIQLANLLKEPVLYAQDLSEHMLNIAEKEAENSGYEITKILSSAEELKIEDNSMDVVTCKQLLHEVKSPENIINEIFRVTKPGGKIFIVDFAKNGGKIAAKMAKTLIKATTNKQIADNFWKSYKNGLDGNEIEKMVKNAGFAKVVHLKAAYNYFILAKK